MIRYIELRLRIAAWICIAAAFAMLALEVRAIVFDIDRPASLFWPAGVFAILGSVLLLLARRWAARLPRQR